MTIQVLRREPFTDEEIAAWQLERAARAGQSGSRLQHSMTEQIDRVRDRLFKRRVVVRDSREL